jgi:hypothetical protein
MDDLVPQNSGGESNDGSPPSESPNAEREKNRRGNAGQIFGEDDCLRGLSQLPGLVALRLIRPAESNAMRGAYAELLRHHDRSQSTPAAAAINEVDVVETLRAHPELLKTFEPFLTDEQLQMVLKQSPNDEQV